MRSWLNPKAESLKSILLIIQGAKALGLHEIKALMYKPGPDIAND